MCARFDRTHVMVQRRVSTEQGAAADRGDNVRRWVEHNIRILNAVHDRFGKRVEEAGELSGELGQILVTLNRYKYTADARCVRARPVSLSIVVVIQRDD